jgi:protein-S-isoprenylcysteine O-methyltransferase Ste14
MTPSMSAEAAFSPSAPGAPHEGRWQKISAYLVRRRVRISLVVFVALMVEDVLTGVTPHDVFNPRDPETLLGCGLIFAGLAIRSWSAGILRKSRELTTTGPYALIRNPLYIGSFLIMSGFCALIDDAENLYFVLGPIAALYFLQVLHEERGLAQMYGARWADYMRNVPRFLPRALPKAPFSTWELREWLGSREYRALGATLLGMLLVQVWRLS